MKNDWIQGKNLNYETMEIEERDNVVIIPAWQFALFIEKYHEYRRSMLMYLGLFVVMVVLWVWSMYLP